MLNQIKYRRLTSLVGVALSLIITGYWLFAGAFQYWQLRQVKAEIHQMLKSHVPDSLLETFSAEQLHEPGIQFVHSREFKLNDYKYDIVDTLQTEDGMIVRCIRDDREKRVEEQLLSVYGQSDKHHSKTTKKAPDLIKYVKDNHKILLNALETTPVYGAVYLARDYRHSNFMESPPPEEYGRFLILS